MIRSASNISIVVVMLLSLVSLNVTAQDGRERPNKYKLSIPDAWRNRSMLRHLTAIAPFVFPRLEEKQFCLDCNTPYSLMFFYDSVEVVSRVPISLATTTQPNPYGGAPVLHSNYECITTYHFKGTWMLLYKDSAISELELVSVKENITARRKFSIQRNVLLITTPGKRPTSHPNPGDDPVYYIQRNPGQFDPTIEDILAVLAQRIKKIKAE